MDKALWQNSLFGVSDTSQMMVQIIVGFFIWETTEVVLNFEEEGVIWLIHAIYSLIPYALSCTFGFIHYYCALVITYEIPTLFLNARWILFKTGRGNGKVYDYANKAFFIAFFLTRVVGGTLYLLAWLIQLRGHYLNLSSKDHVPLWVIIIFFIGNIAAGCLNWYWFYKMCLIAMTGKTDIQDLSSPSAESVHLDSPVIKKKE